MNVWNETSKSRRSKTTIVLEMILAVKCLRLLLVYPLRLREILSLNELKKRYHEKKLKAKNSADLLEVKTLTTNFMVKKMKSKKCSDREHPYQP